MLIGEFNIDRAQRDPKYLRVVKAFLRADRPVKIPCRDLQNGLKVKEMSDLLSQEDLRGRESKAV